MNKKDKFNVAFAVDGSFLPIRNGAFYSIYNLMRALRKSQQVNPTLTICYRGWDDPRLYHRQTFNTAFLKPADFYNDTGILNYTFNVFDIQAAHFYNAEEILNQGRRLQRTGVKVIYEAINIEHVLYGQLGASDKKIVAMKSMQTDACQTADYVLCRSLIDKKHIIQMGVIADKVTAYTGAINVKGIRFRPRKRKRYKIVFLGHMYYPPNENTLELIVAHVFPQLKALDNRYTLTVIGIAPESMIEKYSQLGVKFRGGVDDLSTELLKHDIAISPLYQGSGTRLKILDHLASGMPTITTTLGIEGLKDEISQYVIIEDDIHNYADQIHTVTNHLAEYKNLVYNGRKFVEANYDWSRCLDPFLRIYQMLL